MAHQTSIGTVAREWARLGFTGFGGPQAHVAMLRELCVERERWIEPDEFEHANAACNLLPGPASTQLAIYCALRTGGQWAALIGGLLFIIPGLVMIIALAAISLSSAPADWLRGVGAGAGAAVIGVVLRVGWDLSRSSLAPHEGLRRWRAVVYIAVGAISVIAVGPFVVLALIGCGLIELIIRRAEAPPLYYVTMPTGVMPEVVNAAKARGWLPPQKGFWSLVPESFGLHAAPHTITIDVRAFVPQKLAAILAHRSQMGANHPFSNLAEADARRWLGTEFFRRAAIPGRPGTVLEQRCT